MTKNKQSNNKVAAATKKNKLTLSKNKILLVKLGVVIVCSAVVALIIAIAQNQELFQEFLRVL